jgi:excinuclease ABC subunit C
MKAQQNRLKLQLARLPALPGVYQFLNKDGEVIYVGKAKNLKARVGQYFNRHDDRPQLPYLMREAADLKYTVSASELESLFLENTLIKNYLPRYNILLRDDKNYAFIKIDYSTQIPQIGYARKTDIEDHRNKFFGPYSAAHKIRSTLNLVRKIFPFCANKTVGARPCFYYYLHRCPGVCVGKITLQEYQQQIDRICWFLAGNTAKIKQELKVEMKLAAQKKHFEVAARLRDQLRALLLLDERQNAILPKPVDWDVVSLAASDGFSCINLFKIRRGKLQDKENFVFEASAELTLQPAEVIQKFLEQYYLESSGLPKVIYLQTPVLNPQLIEQIFSKRVNKKVTLLSPQKGKPLELIKLGTTNAEEYLKNWLSSQAGHLDKINEALNELKAQLNLTKIPDRIECYDISNIQGTNPVGSMVVFEQGLPAKSQYRKFKIQTKQTPDDFAMMKEMLSRRLARSGAENPNPWPLPDLIVIDGGKGQLGVAVEVLKDKNFKIPAVGLAKRIEEIFFPGNPEPLVLSHDNPGLQLLQRLRDETHRFGITFHRQLRSKQAVKSALDDIAGIGPKTKKLLKQKFGTVAKIRTTPFEQLKEAVGEHLAQLIQQGL